jgi:hypothetical protein
MILWPLNDTYAECDIFKSVDETSVAVMKDLLLGRYLIY